MEALDTETGPRHRLATGATSNAQRQDEVSIAVLQQFRYHPLPPGDMIRVSWTLAKPLQG